MAFESESEMKEAAVESIPRVLGMDDFEIISEFPYPGGRTDLVCVNVSDSYWQRRTEKLNLDIPISNRKYLIAFLNIHSKKEITEDYYYTIGPMDLKYKKNALEWLKTNGFVIETGDNKIRTAPKMRRHITTTHAIEVKLRKWQKALEQAAGGRAFAEYKYVAICADHVDPALSNLDQFKEKNVGLISINSSGNSTIHYQPPRGDPYSTVNRWEINETTIAKKHA